MKLYWFVCVCFLVIVKVNAGEKTEEVDVEDLYDSFVSKFTNFETLYDKNEGIITYNNQSSTLSLRCSNGKVPTDVIPPFKTMMTVKQLLVEQCALPVAPIVETFQKLNINPDIEMLQLTIPSVSPLPQGNYTQGLTVKSLWIDIRYSPIRDVLSNNPNFLQPLSNLTTLMVWSNMLPPIPANIRLEVLSLRHNAMISKWENCDSLRELKLHNIDHYEIPAKWPASCSSLRTIRLKGLTTVAGEHFLSSGVTEGCKNLTHFYMQSCNQTDMPYGLLRVATDLVYLNFSRNRIIDQSFAEFPVMNNLTHLDLSMNHLTGWFLTLDFVKKLPALRYLNLGGNKFTELFCSYEEKTLSLASIKTLEWLSLNQNMDYRPECFIEHQFSNLKYLGLASTDTDSKYFTDFQLRYLPRTNSSHLEVDLRGRKINELEAFFHKYSYETILTGDPAAFWPPSGRKYEGTNITLLISDLNCDCKHYWLARALRDIKQDFLTLPGARCGQTGRELKDEPLSTMNCNKQEWFGCDVKRFGAITTKEYEENKVTIHCLNPHNNLKYVIPNNGTLTGLNISKGSVSSLDRIDPFPDSIQWIDLRSNNITRLAKNDIALLFPNKERKVWLKGNLILCDCANKLFIDALHEHQNQVMDLNEIICLETGTLLQSVTSYELCQVGMRVTIGIVSVIIVLLLCTFVLLWRYRLHLRIYLYSRGLCLFCLQEDLDADKPYDVFLSFAHGDDEYVMEHLLPKLESEPDFYRVCVHYRDWVVGDWIPTQIMRSVQESKRTVIVLSKNFVGSMWGSLEFRYAIANAEEEGFSRVLILVLDDVLDDKLDAELRGYISFNTYLRCDDPWFWEKLRFSLPRYKQSRPDPRTSPVFSGILESLPLSSVN